MSKGHPISSTPIAQTSETALAQFIGLAPRLVDTVDEYGTKITDCRGWSDGNVKQQNFIEFHNAIMTKARQELAKRRDVNYDLYAELYDIWHL